MNFETADLWLSAFLITCNFSPTLLSRNGRILFSFTPTPDLDSFILDYQNNCSVNVLDYAAAAKTLRGQMLDLKHNHGGGRE
jgi:hypothetical protein